MSLTVGKGPFAEDPAGRFNLEIDPPRGSVLFFDPVPQRIRALFAGETIVDSKHAKLLHETGHLPVYYFPLADVRTDLLERTDKHTGCPHKGEASYWSLTVRGRITPDAVWGYEEPIEPASFLRDHVAIYWHVPDEWFAEDEQLFGHPRDPYSRIDVYRTSRRVRVAVGGETVADSVRTRALFETGLPTRYYFPPEDVRLDLLEPSPKRTRCAYKGSASYWHVRAGGELHDHLAWTYPDPQHDAEPVRDLIAFFNERIDLDVDGESQDRPRTQWSR
jgi:uncharacterized protein (DUF427 family)